MTRPVAFVTGASRGIGRASALALAERGFDLVLAARTLEEGERREHSPTVLASDTRPLPGSLRGTAEAVGARGAAALPVRLDLLEADSVASAVAAAEERFGAVDVLVNNAVYTGPGNLDRITDLPVDAFEKALQANAVSPLRLTLRLLPGMLERGGGRIVNVTSHVATHDPTEPVGRGGWGYAYAGSKAAFHRLAGLLEVELRDRGILAFNLDPGFVVTETMELKMREQGFDALRGAPPRVPAAVVAWLAAETEAQELSGRTVRAQPFCKERGLLPDWP